MLTALISFIQDSPEAFFLFAGLPFSLMYMCHLDNKEAKARRIQSKPTMPRA